MLFDAMLFDAMLFDAMLFDAMLFDETDGSEGRARLNSNGVSRHARREGWPLSMEFHGP
jgi:hypothetical protein